MKTLTKYFSPKVTKSLRFYHRVTKQNFSKTDFHICCDIAINTHTLVKTQFVNVIEIFTSLIWSRAEDEHYKSDHYLRLFCLV
jgi:hypothetical protein